MRPRKNKKRIDPRYFLNETTNRDTLGREWEGPLNPSDAPADSTGRVDLNKALPKEPRTTDLGADPTLGQRDQWDPAELKAIIDNPNLKPNKPKNISDDTWNTSIERCVNGDLGYCPYNYGVSETPAPGAQFPESWSAKMRGRGQRMHSLAGWSAPEAPEWADPNWNWDPLTGRRKR